MMLCVGLVVGLGLGSTVEDADAAKKKELKTLWAIVDSDGNIVRSKGNAVSIYTGRTGVYQIRFNRNVNGCAKVATIDGGSSGEPSFTNYDPSKVDVFTANSSGVLADRAFQLVVLC